MKLLLKTILPNNWKTPVIFCISFISCYFANIAFDIACGPEIDPYDYYTSFFHNSNQGEKEYAPFYFTDFKFLYNDDEPLSEAGVNAADWADYLGKPTKAADVIKAMYNLNGRAEALVLNGFLKNAATLPDSLKNNSFLKALINNKPALKYFGFAKKIEGLVDVAYEAWDPKPVDTVTLQKEAMIALGYAENEKDKFIQLRYYYQAQRLLHYSLNYARASSVYDQYILKSTINSRAKGWALALKAGEERRLGDTVKAAYLFSKVFAQYAERRVQAYKNYHYIGVKPEQVLAIATNNGEKAVIYAMEGFGNPQLTITPLQKVYDFDPASPMVGVLLVREINKLEAVYLTPELSRRNAFVKDISGSSIDDLNASKIYINSLKEFCKLLINGKKYPEPNIGNLALAYLSWLQGSTDEGLKWLKTLYDVKLDARLEDQKQIIQLLLSAQQIQRYDQMSEASMLPSLKWLDAKVRSESIGNSTISPYNYYGTHYFAATARNFYQQILAPAYLKQGDTTRAALALLNGDIALRDKGNAFKIGSGFQSADFWYNSLHSAHLEKLINWKVSPQSDRYLAFLSARLSVVDMNTMDELLGTLYLREHQYKKAVTYLKQVSAVLINKFPTDYYEDKPIRSDPFIERINDYPKVMTYAHGKTFNKLQFAVAMSLLEQQLKTDPDNAASYYYKMATGLYNTSSYGNAWYLISYTWSAADFERGKRYSYDDDYTKTLNAEKYFLLALRLSKTTEFKAKCTFMAAKCRQKQIISAVGYTALSDSAQNGYPETLRDNFYFMPLKKNYRKTAFFKKAVTECSYLKDFIATE